MPGPRTRKMSAGFNPAGPVILPGGKVDVPAGFLSLGREFLVQFPGFIQPHLGEPAPGGRLLKDLEALPELTRKLESFWNDALEAMLPRVDAGIPYSRAGLSLGAPLSRLVTTEADRGISSSDYLQRAAEAQQPDPGMDRFAALLLRQIAVLPLPSATRAEISWHSERLCRIDLKEAGDLSLLFCRLVWSDEENDTSLQRLKTRLPHTDGKYALWLPILRAAQLCRLAIGSGLPQQTHLLITVSHAGLRGHCLKLRLAPSDRGLLFAQLLHALPGTLRSCLTREPTLRALPLTPKLIRDPAEAEDRESPGPVPAGRIDALRWHGPDAEAGRRLTYAGDTGRSAAYPGGLAFALTGERDGALRDPRALVAAPAPGTLQRRAYETWLSGPRRDDGFLPGFAACYLAGLEYRLLSETPDAAETEVLVAELRDLSRLMGGGQELREAASRLLDWLGVTGRSPVSPAGPPGPLGQLALLGCRILDGKALTRDEVLRLWRHWSPGANETISLREVDALIGEGLTLPAPARPLLNSYRSVSGLCDAARVPVLRDGKAVPDLRASAKLAVVFEQLSLLSMER